MSKRSSSALSEPESDSKLEVIDEASPPPYTPKKRKTLSTVSSPNRNGEWTPEKEEKFIERILALGPKHANLDELSAEFGVSKQQVRNAIQAGRKGNLRDKASKSVRGD